jgi:hypothetical protein
MIFKNLMGKNVIKNLEEFVAVSEKLMEEIR